VFAGGGPCNDLFAPTTVNKVASKDNDDGFEVGFSGTSGATPLVTGTVAIFLGQHPDLGANPTEIPGIVTKRLVKTATTVHTLSPHKLLYSLLNFGAGNPTVDRTAIAFTTPVKTNPPSIALKIASSVPGEPVEYWLSLVNRSCWLKVQPPPPAVLDSRSPVLTAPTTVHVSVDVTSPSCMLGPGTYNDSLQVSGTNLNSSITIPVTLQVTAGP
jgi:subtilisin family serine protease